jgi:hypothetical protein
VRVSSDADGVQLLMMREPWSERLEQRGCGALDVIGGKESTKACGGRRQGRAERRVDGGVGSGGTAALSKDSMVQW